MKFLLPTRGRVKNQAFGILATPATTGGVPLEIQFGRQWAADNGCFTGHIEPTDFLKWLDRFEPYRSTCLFVVMPDVVGNSAETIRLFEKTAPMFSAWPLALVAQDWMTNLPELGYSTLFIGGSTEYKLSQTVRTLIAQGVELGKTIHIGRVNSIKRYNYFRLLLGSENFTCDGTRIRYERNRAIKEWGRCMQQKPLFFDR